MHDEFGIESFIFHGICIGAAGGIFSRVLRECPYVKAIVTEGMFPKFYESMKNNLIEKKKPVFIFIDLIDFWMKHFTKHSMKFGPLDIIDKLDEIVYNKNKTGINRSDTGKAIVYTYPLVSINEFEYFLKRLISTELVPNIFEG